MLHNDTTDHLHSHKFTFHSHSLLLGLAAGGAVIVAFTILVFFVLLYKRYKSKKKTSSYDIGTIRRFSYGDLKATTESFGSQNKLGQGGFGAVYRGCLRIDGTDTEVAVKVLDEGSLQGEREFQNELSVMGRIDTFPHPNVVGLLGFCIHKKRKKILVYEYMPNRSLQEALFGDVVRLDWKSRYKIVTDTAQALAFLHTKCDPPIIHGDVKPSNILLDANYSAKLADFGLARIKVKAEDISHSHTVFIDDESESTALPDQSPESVSDLPTTAEMQSPATQDEIADLDTSVRGVAVDDSRSSVPDLESEVSVTESTPKKGQKEWWWKQEAASGELRVKDYVMEWIGSEIHKENSTSVEEASVTSAPPVLGKRRNDTAKKSAKHNKKNSNTEWWKTLSEETEEKKVKSRSKRRESREWWREEYCEELSNKGKKLNNKSRRRSRSLSMEWWRKDQEQYEQEKKQRSIGVADSGALASTPSMRGTVCYVAPEYGGAGVLSEKGDVYSFGVVILVIVAGRRPLQMTASPITELERANLTSWARHLARCGNVLELVDSVLGEDFDRGEALQCITVALLCLQRLPSARPSMSDIVSMLSGEMAVPALPVEFSPSPPYGVPFSTRRDRRRSSSSLQS